MNSALVQIFFIPNWNPHRWIWIPCLGGIRRIDSVILFLGGVVLINCYWGIVAFQCCDSVYYTAKWVCHMYTHTPLWGFSSFYVPAEHWAASLSSSLIECWALGGQALRLLELLCRAWEWTPSCLFSRTLKKILKKAQEYSFMKVPADVSKRQGNHTWLLYWDVKYLSIKVIA